MSDKHTIKVLPNNEEESYVSNKPKVLLVGIYAPTFRPDGQIKGWEDLGYDVVSFDWQRVRFDVGVDGMRDRLLMKARTEEPDLIFMQIQNPDAIDADTAKQLQDIAFTINFTEDVREDITFYEEVGKEIGITIFTNRTDVETLKSKGIKSEYLPTSYNDVWYKPQPNTGNYYGDIVFLGGNYMDTNLKFPKAEERYEMVKFLQKEYKDRFYVGGMGWGDYTKFVHPQEAIQIYNNAKIIVTHSNFNRPGYFSDRNLNAIGCNKLVIQQFYQGIQYDFHASAPYWETLEELKSQIDYYLSNPAQSIHTSNTLYHIIQTEHLWKHRFIQLLKFVDDVK